MVFIFYESIQGQRFEVIPRLVRELFFDSLPFPYPFRSHMDTRTRAAGGIQLPNTQTPGAEAMIWGKFVQFLVPQNSIPS